MGSDSHSLVSSGLTERSELEISDAIQTCVSDCAKNPDAAQCIEAHALGLIARGWCVFDVKAVCDGAVNVLSTIKKGVREL